MKTHIFNPFLTPQFDLLHVAQSERICLLKPISAFLSHPTVILFSYATHARSLESIIGSSPSISLHNLSVIKNCQYCHFNFLYVCPLLSICNETLLPHFRPLAYVTWTTVYLRNVFAPILVLPTKQLSILLPCWSFHTWIGHCHLSTYNPQKSHHCLQVKTQNEIRAPPESLPWFYEIRCRCLYVLLRKTAASTNY